MAQQQRLERAQAKAAARVTVAAGAGGADGADGAGGGGGGYDDDDDGERRHWQFVYLDIVDVLPDASARQDETNKTADAVVDAVQAHNAGARHAALHWKHTKLGSDEALADGAQGALVRQEQKAQAQAELQTQRRTKDETAAATAEAAAVASMQHHLHSLFGGRGCETFRGARLLLAGGGALGTEMAKCLAVTGFCTGDRGHCTVADSARLQPADLGQSALHPERHRRRLLGSLRGPAMATALHVHPHPLCGKFKCSTVEVDLGRDGGIAEQAFGDAVWKESDAVLSAVDTFGKRRLLGRHAVQFGKPMVDGGVDGLRGHVEVTVPFVTSCYADHADPTENAGAPHTVQSFPLAAADCYEWAKERLDSAMYQAVADVGAYCLAPAAWFDGLPVEEGAANLHQQRKRIAAMQALLPAVRAAAEKREQVQTEGCVALGCALFKEMFGREVRQVRMAHPTKPKKGKSVWQSSPGGVPPRLLKFNPGRWVKHTLNAEVGPAAGGGSGGENGGEDGDIQVTTAAAAAAGEAAEDELQGCIMRFIRAASGIYAAALVAAPSPLALAGLSRSGAGGPGGAGAGGEARPPQSRRAVAEARAAAEVEARAEHAVCDAYGDAPEREPDPSQKVKATDSDGVVDGSPNDAKELERLQADLVSTDPNDLDELRSVGHRARLQPQALFRGPAAWPRPPSAPPPTTSRPPAAIPSSSWPAASRRASRRWPRWWRGWPCSSCARRCRAASRRACTGTPSSAAGRSRAGNGPCCSASPRGPSA
jgi:molybdopterin/thiamine biosynthesis adenylyltransferase